MWISECPPPFKAPSSPSFFAALCHPFAFLKIIMLRSGEVHISHPHSSQIPLPSPIAWWVSKECLIVGHLHDMRPHARQKVYQREQPFVLSTRGCFWSQNHAFPSFIQERLKNGVHLSVYCERELYLLQKNYQN